MSRRVWIAGIAVCILLGTLLVCRHRAGAQEDVFQAVWRSCDATAPELAEAINRRFATGTLESVMKSVLGPCDDRDYFHGWNVSDVKEPAKAPLGLKKYRVIRLAYQRPDGRIFVFLEPLSRSNLLESRFLRASAELRGGTNNLLRKMEQRVAPKEPVGN